MAVYYQVHARKIKVICLLINILQKGVSGYILLFFVIALNSITKKFKFTLLTFIVKKMIVVLTAETGFKFGEIFFVICAYIFYVNY